MTPEERSEYAKKLAAYRKPANMKRPYRASNKGTPKGGWTGEAASVAKAAARLEAMELISRLKAQGLFPPQDQASEEATIEALTLVRSPGGKTEKRKKAKQLLRFYAPELAHLV